MSKKYGEKNYRQYAETTLIPNYFEGLNLDQIQWRVLNAQQLYEFLISNYTHNIEGEMEFVGNVSEYNEDYYENCPLGMKYLPFESPEIREIKNFMYGGFYPDSSNYLIATVHNKIGKETIIAALTYRYDRKIYSDQIVPTTLIDVVEVNSLLPVPGIYEKMANIFTKIVDKNNHVVMILLRECLSAYECERDIQIFNIIKNTAQANGFPKLVMLADYENDEELKSVICPQSQTSKR
jgi:hypothetical protein